MHTGWTSTQGGGYLGIFYTKIIVKGPYGFRKQGVGTLFLCFIPILFKSFLISLPLPLFLCACSWLSWWLMILTKESIHRLFYNITESCLNTVGAALCDLTDKTRLNLYQLASPGLLQSVIVISFSLSKSDNIKQLLLYDYGLLLFSPFVYI